MGRGNILVRVTLAEKKSCGYNCRPMKFLRIILSACAALFCLTGCLQIEKVVKVNADGSGTVEETLMLSKASLAQMKQMTGGLGGQNADPAKEFKLLDEAKLKGEVGKMGEGVTFVSATPISNAQGEGFKAIYAFTDINKLKIDQNPSGSMPSGGGMKEEKKEPVAFKFTKGKPAELVVTMPQPEFKPKKEQPPGMEDMAMQMMQQIFKDMKITLAVEVAGGIKETNAEYKDGSRVTLMEMDMNKVLADPEKFKALAKANPQSLQETKTLMKGINGVKIETAPEVKIKFP